MAPPVYQAVVASSLPYADNFDRPNSGTLGTDWTSNVGNFGVSGNAALGQSATNIATVNTLTADSLAVQGDVSLTAGQSVGLVARYAGSGQQNFYLGYMTNTGNGITASIYRNVNGTYTQLSSQAVGTATGTLRFEVTGSSLKLFLNNTLVTSSNDTNLASGGFGLYSTANVAVDNFSATAITPVAQTLPFSDSFDTSVNQQLNPNAWTNQAGVFTVQNGVAAANGPIGVASVNGISAANVATSATVAVGTAGQYAGLIARYSGTGDSNYYLATLYNTGSGIQANIYSNIGGQYKLLNQQTVSSGNSGQMQFEVSGTSLKLFLNGTLVALANDSALTTGSVGIRAAAGGIVDSFNASAITVTAQTLPFTDSFSTADRQQLNSTAWTNQFGGFQVANGVATGLAGGGQASLNGLSATDVAVQADVNVSMTNQAAGLVARYSSTGDSNYYMAYLVNTGNGVSAQIFRNVNGAYTLLSQAVAPTAGGLLRFEASGSSLKLFLNGTLLTSATDTMFTAGTVGIRSTAGSTFDNFSATAITVVAQNLPFADNFDTSVNGQLSAAWINQVNTVQVISNAATSNAGLASVSGVSASNVVVQADVSVNTSGKTVGLLARYGGPGDTNYYMAYLYNTGNGVSAQIYRSLGGNFTLVGSGVAPTSSGTMRFEVSGTSMKLFLNNTLLASGNDSAISSGSVGMRITGGGAVDNFSATALTTVQQTLPFSDNYNTSVNGQLNSAAWTNQAGLVQVVNAAATASGTVGLATVNGISATNVSVTADASVTTSGQLAGLVARYSGTGDSNYYLATLYNSGSGIQAAIWRNINGTYTQLDSRAVGSATGTMTFEVSGTSLKMFLNGTLVSYANDTMLTSGTVGVRLTANGTVDNFNASTLVTAAQSVPFVENFDNAMNGQLNSIAWTNQLGSFLVSNSVASSLSPVALAMVNGISVANVTVQAQVSVLASGQASGLLARYSGPGESNFYLADLFNTGGGTVARIWRNVGGTYTLLGQVTAPASSGLLRFEVSGTSLKLFLNGNQLLSANDSMLTSGTVGMRSTGGATTDTFTAT